jgi:hypothetical protein
MTTISLSYLSRVDTLEQVAQLVDSGKLEAGL